MKRTIVISAFPASGKSTYFREHNCDSEVIIDSDSSQFSWIKDTDGANTTTRNPEFPNNYMRHIRYNMGKADIIFVSSHEVVRTSLREHGIPYVLVFPDRCMNLVWKHRMEARGDDSKFVSFILDNWDKFLDDMEAEYFPAKLVLYLATNRNALTPLIMNYIKKYL